MPIFAYRNSNLNDMKSYIGLTEHNYQQLDYDDGELAIINHLTFTPRMHSTQFDMVFIAMCNLGTFTFDMDGTEYTLAKDDIFIGYPNAIYKNFVMSSDLDCRLICISRPLLMEMLYPNQGIWNKTLYLKRHHILHLTPEEAILREGMNALIMYDLELGDTLFRKEIMHSLVQTIVYALCRTLSKETVSQSSRETNQKKILFDRFISLLSGNEIKKHPLSYYADILCVSPRYLSMVCREISNKTAYDWICEYVQNDVRYHLLHTNLSIKEISIKLGFCNLSFFGKYVRENFGKSPSDFRRVTKEK